MSSPSPYRRPRGKPPSPPSRLCLPLFRTLAANIPATTQERTTQSGCTYLLDCPLLSDCPVLLPFLMVQLGAIEVQRSATRVIRQLGPRMCRRRRRTQEARVYPPSPRSPGWRVTGERARRGRLLWFTRTRTAAVAGRVPAICPRSKYTGGQLNRGVIRLARGHMRNVSESPTSVFNCLGPFLLTFCSKLGFIVVTNDLGTCSILRIMRRIYIPSFLDSLRCMLARQRESTVHDFRPSTVCSRRNRLRVFNRISQGSRTARTRTQKNASYLLTLMKILFRERFLWHVNFADVDILLPSFLKQLELKRLPGRKLKCDGNKPRCSNCYNRQEVCEYVDRPKRRGPGKAAKGSRAKKRVPKTGRHGPDGFEGINIAPELRSRASFPESVYSTTSTLVEGRHEWTPPEKRRKKRAPSSESDSTEDEESRQ